MIKQRRLPLRTVVAIGTGRDVIRCPGKLQSVCILVALLAFHRSCREIRIGQLSAHVRRLVAVDARHRAVRANQYELCLGVIELG